MSDEHNGGGQSAPERSVSTPQAKESANQPQSAAPTARKPKIGDKRPAPEQTGTDDGEKTTGQKQGQKSRNRNRRRRRGGGGQGQGDAPNNNQQNSNRGGGGGEKSGSGEGGGQRRRRRRGGRGRGGNKNNNKSNEPVTALTGEAVELDEETLAMRKGRERKGKPAGRYMMCVSVRDQVTQIAVLEGRTLIEHYVSRPSDDVSQIHGNIYLGKVQNVLPGMEAAFIDITTPKNAVLYRGDVSAPGSDNRGTKIEQLLRPKENILCQVTKNPIAHKGARLTQEVSLPGRFVVLVPNSTTYGISKRLPERERKRLRKILDRVKPDGAGIIVRTAAENITEEEVVADVRRLAEQWEAIDQLAKQNNKPALLYREPEMAVRVIREEFNKDYRGIVIDDENLYNEVADYVRTISPALTDRVSHYDAANEKLSLFERHHVHEQLHKALDRKVWLPSVSYTHLTLPTTPYV